MASDSDTLLIFKMRGIKSPSAEQTSGPQIMLYHEELPERRTMPEYRPRGDGREEPTSIYYKVGREYPDPMRYYKEAIREGGKETAVVQTAPKGRADSKEMAKGLYCVAHPFRHAYAICSYCHRPFCFEDIIEYQKDYYCIEDIDRVTAYHKDRLTYEYSTSSIITSFILTLSFILFIFYSYGQLGYVLNYLLGSPLRFFSGINFAYVITLASLVVMLFTFGAALYILLGSRQGHVVASVISMAAVMLFVYQFIGTGTEYMAIIAVLEFAAFLSAVHSAASGALVYNKTYDNGMGYELAYSYGSRY